MVAANLLVVAKAPVAGQVKTRLGAVVGTGPATQLAAAALLDSLRACRAAVGAEHCHLALAGELAAAVRHEEIASALQGWSVRPQRGPDFAARLVAAHADVPGPVLQIGMDTPQVTPALLRATAVGLTRYDAVLAPAADGGWWALGLRDPAAARVLATVPMSTPTTYDATLAALRDAGLSVGTGPELRDVDEAADAAAVAVLAPESEFARVWAEVRVGSR